MNTAKYLGTIAAEYGYVHEFSYEGRKKSIVVKNITAKPWKDIEDKQHILICSTRTGILRDPDTTGLEKDALLKASNDYFDEVS